MPFGIQATSSTANREKFYKKCAKIVLGAGIGAVTRVIIEPIPERLPRATIGALVGGVAAAAGKKAGVAAAVVYAVATEKEVGIEPIMLLVGAAEAINGIMTTEAAVEVLKVLEEGAIVGAVVGAAAGVAAVVGAAAGVAAAGVAAAGVAAAGVAVAGVAEKIIREEVIVKTIKAGTAIGRRTGAAIEKKITGVLRID